MENINAKILNYHFQDLNELIDFVVVVNFTGEPHFVSRFAFSVQEVPSEKVSCLQGKN